MIKKAMPILEKGQKLLTDVELEIMNILWRLGEGTVNDVIESLPENRPLAYTSVSTIMRILEQKNVLQTRKEGRGHVYIPIIKKDDYEKTTLKHIVEKVFAGAPVSLAKQLISSTPLSQNELIELKQLLDSVETKN